MTILIVGGGKVGHSHLALVTQYVGKTNVALCDSKLVTRLLFRLLGYRTFASVDKAAARLEKLDGVLIATPTPSHAALARWAIDRRIPVFVEKPLTLDVVRSGELVDLAGSNDVPAQVGFVLRYVASFQRLRQLVADGGLGEVVDYSASMRGNVITKPLAPDAWQADFRRGGGCLNEYGPHLIDLCRFIFGPVAMIDQAEMERVYSVQADDKIRTAWRHESGTSGNLKIDWCDPAMRKSVIEFNVRFAHGDLRADNSTLDVTWHENAPLSVDQRATLASPVRPVNVGFYLRGEEFSLELEAFLGTCLGRNFHVDPAAPSDTTPTLSDGYEVDRLIDDIARKVGLK